VQVALNANRGTQQCRNAQAQKHLIMGEHLNRASFARDDTILLIYSLNCVSFAKCRALACISLRFSVRNRSSPNFSTQKLPSTDP